MKIAFVFPPQWCPHTDSSLQLWNRAVSTRLAKDCDVDVYYSATISPSKKGCIDGVNYRRVFSRWEHRLVKLVYLIHLKLGIKRPLFSTDLWFPGYALGVALQLRKHKADIVHVYNFPQYGALIKHLNPSAQVVLNMHGEILTQVKFANVKARLSKMAHIVSCSDLLTEGIRHKFPELADRCVTVPMGIVLEAFDRPDLASRPHRPFSKRLLCVTRLSPEKGPHVLVDAFNLIAQRYPDATLTVVGPEGVSPRGDIADLCLDKKLVDSFEPFYRGNYLKMLEQRVSSEAAPRVKFTGLIPHEEVYRHYAESDIYVSPTYYESFGMSIIEAMAAGLPVVACRGGAVTDFVVDNQNGLLADVGAPSGLADAVGKFFSDPQLRESLASSAKEMVRKRYSWNNIASSLMDVYRGVRHESPECPEAVNDLRVVPNR